MMKYAAKLWQYHTADYEYDDNLQDLHSYITHITDNGEGYCDEYYQWENIKGWQLIPQETINQLDQELQKREQQQSQQYKQQQQQTHKWKIVITNPDNKQETIGTTVTKKEAQTIAQKWGINAQIQPK